jgi:SAM-dependent methyltransferase
MPKRESEIDRIRIIYDRRGADELRRSGGEDLRWLCSQAVGDTLEVGIGHGRTLPYYPRNIRLSGIELSPKSLEGAERRARDLGIDADLRIGDASALPYPDDHFDTVIFSFSLCTIPDDRGAIAEAARVLRPCGRIALVEHVRSPRRLVRGLERLAEPITVRRMGDHLLRDPLDHILAEDLEVEFLERRMLGLVERLIARKPDADDLAEAV